MWTRPVVASVAALLLAPAAAAQPPQLTKDLETAVKSFEQTSSAAREAALRAFDKQIRLVQAGPGQPAVKATKEAQRKRAKDEFASSGEWPNGHIELIQAEWDHAMALQKSYRPVSNAYERLIAATRDQSAVQQGWVAEKEKFDKRFPGRAAFTSKTKWHGSRYNAKGEAVKVHLNIGQVDGVLFKGALHVNPGTAGHPEFVVEGQLDGLQLTFTKAVAVQGGGGKGQANTLKGVISGDRILVEINHPVKGKVGIAVLNKQ
jgi:hypothetical protein